MKPGLLLRLIITVGASLLGLAPAWAAQWMSTTRIAPLMDAPSAQAKPRYAVHTLMPLEVLVSLGDKVKVRGPLGEIGWIHRSFLSSRRTVYVVVDAAPVRRSPSNTAPVEFTAERDVVLDYVGEATAGWVQVRHSDGASGFIAAAHIWGE
jgi:SH3-like domain-containing protein